MAPRILGGRAALLVDDEPEYLTWVSDFLDRLNVRSEFAQTINQAIDMMSKRKYEVLLIDMNIPPGGAMVDEIAKGRSDLVETYPGIALAFYARNNGYREYQVIAYTVHDDDAADAELQRLSCRYVLKGRPEVLKIVLKRSFEKVRGRKAKRGSGGRKSRSGGRRPTRR